ncbi:Arc family DNA-binding protein [Methylobacterium sp. CCH5-D2]|uniref:Arc family DNA-binding protein n=1 Tax=Methylobacterium sp. CCH5-D2 TaxID=1768765 RepID=UPI0009E8441F|nr:Arc family DNA-binding protein [Methylobacterium sp. CCH5-D2]
MTSDEHHPSDLADRFQVRMPPGMRERIADEARANNRSMNAEIVARLQQSLSGGSMTFDKDIVREIAAETAKHIAFEIRDNFDATSFRIVEVDGRRALVPNKPEDSTDD